MIYLATPARRGRTGYRSRTHLSFNRTTTLCRAEKNTPEMEWRGAVRTIAEARKAVEGTTKRLCANCVALAWPLYEETTEPPES